jgi:diguanylate cyclase (GGDEF)-like protein
MIAKTLKNNLRDSDKAFRWGGDEFALLLFDINNNKKLFKLLERLKLLINESFINHKQEKLSVTMSFGATKLSKNDTIESLTKRADNNMYESKKQGKNQITVN